MCHSQQPCPCPRPCGNAPEHGDLMKHGSMVRFGRGDVLWSDGDPADWLGVVCVGTLKLTRPSEGTTDTMVDIVERGRMFGEEALVQGAQRPWTATAISSGRLIKLDGETARHHLQQPDSRALMDHMFGVMVERSQNLRHRFGDITDGAVGVRLARVILRLADRVGLADSRGQFLPIRLTRLELAGFLGCREETVIRHMSRWERAEVLLTTREGMVLQGRHLLEQEAGLLDNAAAR